MKPNRTPIRPGFITLHGNQSELLAQTTLAWLDQNPLNPLEDEVVLVQSNGMAEWFKMELARLGHVCAATRVELPSRFLWRTYRQVLGAGAVPRDSPLDKIPMTWRLMAVLPQLLAEPDFAPVKGYLRADEPERSLQLASKLADLFDQYQNYRSDWLEDWAQGRDVLRRNSDQVHEIPAEQRWQPHLWRAVLATLDEGQREAIRPRLHRRAVLALQEPGLFQGQVARRVVVFGMSHMPNATLEALAALSTHCQVILAVPNPCRYYWGDIMEGRELFNTLRRRQALKPGKDFAAISLEDMHVHANPLLASWGRQGRDFVRMLDAHDDVARTREDFHQLRIDLFDDSGDTDDTPMLLRVQNNIRDLEPLSATSPENPPPLSPGDRSITFHIAHNRVRELEILHDQLLHKLIPPSVAIGEAIKPLQPRDIVVMVPDIEVMAPAIRAVFGQFKRDDKRYIPFDIADISAKSSHPAITALEWLLKLPQQRGGMSELVDLLEVPAVAARFGIQADDLPTLTQWMVGAGIRWGLDADHRQSLGLQACGDQNSALFGLQRMMLGYASGDLHGLEASADLAEIEPYTEVGGLDAELAGSLAHLLQTLVDWVSISQTPAAPVQWADRGRALIEAMFKPVDDGDRHVLSLMDTGLSVWLAACDQAAFEEALPLFVARQAWLDALETPSLDHKFRAGGVTFCTLMPMRAIPFEVVCLLGMNDGDYPRRTLHTDFDLMRLSGQHRPGDRSRQHDDRQLMLEALLSARRALYISWTGRNVRDNSEQPASVLVSQLRDYLSALWGQEAVRERTTEHPLQPFSRRYFEQGPNLLTYAREWRAVHLEPDGSSDPLPDLAEFVPDPKVPLTLGRLAEFLRNPVKTFFKDRLSIRFDEDPAFDHDVEPFDLDGLENYGLIKAQVRSWQSTMDDEALHLHILDALKRQLKAGILPMHELGRRKRAELQEVLSTMAQAWSELHLDYPDPAPRRSVRMEHKGLVFEDWIDQLQCNAGGGDEQLVWLHLEPGKLFEKKQGKPQVRPDKLLGSWIRMLAATAQGHPFRAVVVGQDARLDIQPMDPETARAQFTTVLDLWLQGMKTPLPLPFKTALAVPRIAPGNALTKAVEVYEGDEFNRDQKGEVKEPCLARQFPDFEALAADQRLHELATTVYQPLLDWVAQSVVATPHGKL